MLVFLVILLCAILYTLPGLIALGRQHPNGLRVWLVDIVLGFTVIGWLWALRDALSHGAVHRRKSYYSYSDEYGEKKRHKGFDLRHLPLTSDVGLAVAGLALVALGATLGWQHMAPQRSATKAAAAAAAIAPVSAPQGWSYRQEADLSRGTVVRSSVLMSDNNDADSSVSATLIVRSSASGVNVAVVVDGQFTCSAARNGTISVRFDNGPAEALHCAGRPDSNPMMLQQGEGALFIAEPEAFMARMLGARSVVISADLLGQGVQSMHFSPQGLNVVKAGLPQTADAAEIPGHPASALHASAPAAR